MMLRSRGQAKDGEGADSAQSEDSSTSSKPKPMAEQSQWVVMMPKEVYNDTLVEQSSPEKQPVFIKLRHPKSDEGVQFLLSPESKTVNEILSFQETKGSWFIDDTVQQDGRLLMATKVDPLFLILPYLHSDKNTTKHLFVQLDQIVTDPDYPQCHRLVDILDHQSVCKVCDSKGNEDFKVYRYNEEKTLAWLRSKVERTADYLSTSDVPVASGQCSGYVKSSKPEAAPREDCIKYAAGLISDYLHPDISRKLFSSFGIKEETTKRKTKQEKENKAEEPPQKKVKKASGEPDEDYSKAFPIKQEAKPVKLTPAQKRLAKVDKTGMKSLNSFFKKK